MKELGRRIRQKRREKGWTQARLAREIDYSEGHISHIEHGKHPSIGVAVLYKIAKALDTPMTWFIEGDSYYDHC